VGIQGHLRYRRIPISPLGPHNAMVEDLSKGGVRFRVDEFLSRKANLLLEVHLPGAHPVRTLASVAWVRELPEDEGFDVGGSFVDPPHEARAAFEKLVSGN
jgi:hypothetical protein